MTTCREWYKVLRLKKIEVITQLIVRKISHRITAHTSSLKSKLYQHIKNLRNNLISQFKEVIGDDWEIAFNQSGKSFKEFKRDLLRRFHPDINGGCIEATQITQTINNWEEPIQEILFEGEGPADMVKDMFQSLAELLSKRVAWRRKHRPWEFEFEADMPF